MARGSGTRGTPVPDASPFLPPIVCPLCLMTKADTVTLLDSPVDWEDHLLRGHGPVDVIAYMATVAHWKEMTPAEREAWKPTKGETP